MEVRNQNIKTSRLRTFAAGSPVKNSMRSRFAKTDHDSGILSSITNHEKVLYHTAAVFGVSALIRAGPRCSPNPFNMTERT